MTIFNRGGALIKGNRCETIPVQGDFELDQTFTVIYNGESVS
jgi:hypothetical protein